VTPGQSPGETLDLADWRRRVADLYAAVRALSTRDPAAAWGLWRETRDALFRDHPQSPLPAAARAAFRARHWPYAPALRFEVPVSPAVDGAPAGTPAEGAPADGAPGELAIELPVSTGGVTSFTRIGSVSIPFPAGDRTLGLFWMAGYAGGLFLPFRDATNGIETYGAGRYLLDGAKSADLGPGAVPGSLVLDFNFAYQPSCAFDPRWSCPLAPPENRLDIRIEAGERLS